MADAAGQIALVPDRTLGHRLPGRKVARVQRHHPLPDTGRQIIDEPSRRRTGRNRPHPVLGPVQVAVNHVEQRLAGRHHSSRMVTSVCSCLQLNVLTTKPADTSISRTSDRTAGPVGGWLGWLQAPGLRTIAPAAAVER